jgi:hypothetical protein
MGRSMIDLTGLRSGRLLVSGLAGWDGSCTWWLCKCDCGAEVKVRAQALRKAKPQVSCGCVHATETHGLTKGGKRTPEYVSWLNMRQRCTDPKVPCYERYGGRGISVCERWMDSFPAFLEDMGKKPGRGYSIERSDNDGNYEPGNCVWATPTQQRRNMSTNRMVVVGGAEVCLAEACEQAGLKYGAVRQRMYRGATFAEAFR